MQLAFNKPVRIPSWAVVSFTNPQYTAGDLQVRSVHCAKCCYSSTRAIIRDAHLHDQAQLTAGRHEASATIIG